MSLPDSLAAEGIQLRRLHLADAPALCAAYQRSEADLDPSVVVTDTIERACAAIAAFDQAFVAGTFAMYGVFDRDAFVGCASVQPIDPRAFNIGIWIDAPARRCGLAGRAVAAMTQLAFERLSADRTELWIEPTNTAMRCVAERAGYVLEATLRAWTFDPRGARRDQCIYRASADAYRASVPLQIAARPVDVAAFEAWEWSRLVERLGAMYEIVRDGGNELALAVDVVFASGARTRQHVELERRRLGDAPWLVVRSTIGPSALEPDEALEQNATIAAGAIALVGSSLVLRYGLPPASLTTDGLARVIALVAHEAARLRSVRRAGPEAHTHAFAAFVE